MFGVGLLIPFVLIATVVGEPEEHILDLVVDEQLVHFGLPFECYEESGVAQFKL